MELLAMLSSSMVYKKEAKISEANMRFFSLKLSEHSRLNFVRLDIGSLAKSD